MIANLLKLNVQDHVEKKNGLTYLSWAWAWAEALKADPTATFHVDTFQRVDGTTIPYMDINGTAMVWVRTTLFSKEMTCMLPVMDHRNKPIQNPDAFQVNTAIMRCLTKCLAMHGLGLYIYAGEDLPEDDGVVPPPKPKAEPKAEKPTEPTEPSKPPAKIEGRPGRWQLSVALTPEGSYKDWENIVIEASQLAMGLTSSVDELMELHKVNKKIYARLQEEKSSDGYKRLMSMFTDRKKQLEKLP
jgi:hypothetical protein